MRFALAAITLGGCFPGVLLPLGPAELDDGVRLERGLCSDLVPARINDTLGWFQLDSGTYMHLLEPEFVERAQLPIDIDTENAGPTLRATIGKADLAIPRVVRVQDPEMAVADEDSNLSGNWCGVDGLLAPALLATADLAIVIDYGGRTVRSERGDVIIAELGARDRRFVAKRSETDYIPAIDVELGGHKQRLFVDTGAFASFVTKASPTGQALLGKSRSGGKVHRIDGKVGYRVVDTRVKFGTIDRSIGLMLTDPYPYDGDEIVGVLGMDALAGCTLAFTRDEVYGACP